MLGLALDGEARLDAGLAFTDNLVVKAAETGLVVLLTIHLAFGLRLMMLEFGTWRNERNLAPQLIDAGIVLAALIGGAFIWRIL
ncbi:MAG: hypothetical protein DHS20C01_19900 [marine bacterium B5-7]|nr:MAG: hypothetical protein DHS20C01_19900 [marine bacterium B5-7]